MSQPKVSIVVPCYKVEQYLDRCLNSLVKQTLQDLEIILVDDESPDNVPEICDEWAGKDSRIRVIHKKNGGLGMACNSGLDIASGKYVAFCDSDDWVDVDMYETMYNVAEKHHAQMVFTGLKRVNDHGDVSPMNHISQKQVYCGQEQVDELMLDLIASKPSDPIERHIQMSAKVVLYTRDYLNKYNIRFESERNIISEDLFFNIDNLVHANCVVVLPNTFYNYYYNSQSLSTAVRKDRFEKNLEMRDLLLKRYLFREMPVGFSTRVNRMFIGYNRSDIRQICQTSSLQKTEKNKWLKDICNHPIWRELYQLYPIKQMPLKHKLFFLFILRSNFFMLRLMASANIESFKKYYLR